MGNGAHRYSASLGRGHQHEFEPGALDHAARPDAGARHGRRRAAAAGIATKLGNPSFRATGITAYLKNGGTLEKAAAMANHASTRTTQLYDRRRDELSLDEGRADHHLRQWHTCPLSPARRAQSRRGSSGSSFEAVAQLHPIAGATSSVSTRVE